MSREREFLTKAPPTELSAWLSFYETPSRITARLLHHFLPKKKIGGPKKHRLSSWVLLTLSAWRNLSSIPGEAWKGEFEKLTPQDKEEVDRELRESFEQCKRYGSEARDMLSRLTTDDESDYGPGEIDPSQTFKVPEVVWAFQVLFPCLLEYQRNPYRLFEQARQGDWEAIELLIRLDKSVIGDPKIAARVAEHGQRCAEKCQMLAAALTGSPNSPLRMSTMKVGLAAFLRLISVKLGQPLTFREIRRLMDAYARSEGKTCDEDLPLSDEAFAQNTKRAVRKLKLEEWDIFSWIKCPAFAPELPLSSGHEYEPRVREPEAA